jgi:nucleoside 2-deoxyribosyltransferase
MPASSERNNLRQRNGELRVNVTGDGGVDLLGLKVFVGGPIQHAVSPRGQLVPALHELLVKVITVIEEGGGEVLSAHVVERFGQISHQFGPEEVTARDYLWMTQCDAYLPILPSVTPGTLMRTDGTHIELGWASALGKPILVLTDIGEEPGGSHLLRGLPAIATASFLDIDDVMRKPETVAEYLHDVRWAADGTGTGQGPLPERSSR